MTSTPGSRPGSRPGQPPVSRAGFVGIGGLACLLFVDLASAPAVPWWVTALLVVRWLVLFGLAVRWFTPRPVRLPWLVVAGFASWCAAIAGVAALG